MLKILGKIILPIHEAWSQILSLVFALILDFLTKQTQIKNKNLYN